MEGEKINLQIGCVTILALFRVYHFHKDSHRAREIYLLRVS